MEIPAVGSQRDGVERRLDLEKAAHLKPCMDGQNCRFRTVFLFVNLHRSFTKRRICPEMPACVLNFRAALCSQQGRETLYFLIDIVFQTVLCRPYLKYHPEFPAVHMKFTEIVGCIYKPGQHLIHLADSVRSQQ